MADLPIRILVIDDHPLVRESLTLFLNSDPELKVVSNCEDAESGYNAILEFEPDIVLIDIGMPGRCAFDVVRSATAQGSKAKFIFLSAYLSDTYLREAVDATASGYVLKNSSVKTIVEAIRAVMAGRQFFSPEVEGRLYKPLPKAGAEKISRGDALTPREVEVLRYIARGMAVKDIAQVMHLSARTVDRHKANIMEKLDIHSQVGLTRYAIAEGYSDIRSVLLPVIGDKA